MRQTICTSPMHSALQSGIVDAAPASSRRLRALLGQYGHAGDGGPGTSALLQYPTGLALDGQGSLLIEDQGYLWRLNLTSWSDPDIRGHRVSYPNPCSPNVTAVCPALQTNFYFEGPTIVAHGGYLYAAPAYIFGNQGPYDPSIVSINLSSGSVQMLAGGGTQAGTPTSIYPGIGLDCRRYSSLAVDGAGNLFSPGQYRASDSGAQPNSQPCRSMESQS